MKTYPFLLLAAALFAGGCQSAPANSNPANVADITVNFKDPDNFTDVRDSSGVGFSQYYLDLLGKHLKETAAARLTAGQKLTVTFTNIDLAGDIPPGSINNVRVIKPIYIPRMDLSFKLTDASGAVLKEGQRHLTDMDFQLNTATLVNRSDPLYYDKSLLSNWVRDEFKP